MKKIVLQIFTGGFNSNYITFDRIEEKLNYVLNKIDVEKVIIGWSTNKELYFKTIELCRKYKIKVYLWLPVFSEIGLLKESELLVDKNLNSIKNYSLSEDENFEFYCPNNEVNIQNVFDVYEEYFSDLNFDGIFIDKIRYASFANGLNGVLSCFCEHCDKFDLPDSLDIPMSITSYNEGIYTFNDERWQHFFKYKANSINEALHKFYTYFHERNLEVGIDTYAPFLSYFTGQNLALLKDNCDFIKPMMYRITQAPAGLPFEFEKMIKQCSKDYETSKNHMLNILNIEDDITKEFPISFVRKELNFMTGLNIPVYIGMEINYKKDIAEVNTDYIRNNLNSYKDLNIEGYVLSWDLLSAPSENIDEVIKFMENNV